MESERFLKAHGLSGAELLLRVGAIAYMEPRLAGENGECTAIMLTTGRTVLVREGPDELLAAATPVVVRFVDDE
jgi:hypothetical protein